MAEDAWNFHEGRIFSKSLSQKFLSFSQCHQATEILKSGRHKHTIAHPQYESTFSCPWNGSVSDPEIQCKLALLFLAVKLHLQSLSRLIISSHLQNWRYIYFPMALPGYPTFLLHLISPLPCKTPAKAQPHVRSPWGASHPVRHLAKHTQLRRLAQFAALVAVPWMLPVGSECNPLHNSLECLWGRLKPLPHAGPQGIMKDLSHAPNPRAFCTTSISSTAQSLSVSTPTWFLQMPSLRVWLSWAIAYLRGQITTTAVSVCFHTGTPAAGHQLRRFCILQTEANECSCPRT